MDIGQCWTGHPCMQWDEYAKSVKRNIEDRLQCVNSITQEIRLAKEAVGRIGEGRGQKAALLFQCLEQRSIVLELEAQLLITMCDQLSSGVTAPRVELSRAEAEDLIH